MHGLYEIVQDDKAFDTIEFSDMDRPTFLSLLETQEAQLEAIQFEANPNYVDDDVIDHGDDGMEQ